MSRTRRGLVVAAVLLVACTTPTAPAGPTQVAPAVTLPAEHVALCGASLAESCRLLAHYPLAALEGEGQCRLCGAERCMPSWPGPASCTLWAELERCTWQASGARHLSALDVVARDNVLALQQRADAAGGCAPAEDEGVR